MVCVFLIRLKTIVAIVYLRAHYNLHGICMESFRDPSFVHFAAGTSDDRRQADTM